MTDCDVAIIGAGPYGLSAAAHLRHIAGLQIAVFGEPMAFWQKSMPPGMLLRSAWTASHIADPDCALTLDAFGRTASGNHLSAPVPLNRFVDYGLWFQRAAVPQVDTRTVTCLEVAPVGFRLHFAHGAGMTARRVIVAAGISAFAHRPSEFQRLPRAFVSHSSEQMHPKFYSGRRVVVIGGGQSALESAALLHEAGVEVEVLTRRSSVHWLGWKERLQALGPIGRIACSPADVGPAGVSRLVAVPDLFRKLPRAVQERLRLLCLRPAGALWLRQRLWAVPITMDRSVIAASVQGRSIYLTLNDSSVRVADHVLLGTGYRVDICRYPFLSGSIAKKIETVNGFPKLNAVFESSVPGLHFAGAPSAWAFGPLMHFVSGTRYSADVLLRSFSGKSGVAKQAA